jgi:hypothetical protein
MIIHIYFLSSILVLLELLFELIELIQEVATLSHSQLDRVPHSSVLVGARSFVLDKTICASTWHSTTICWSSTETTLFAVLVE